MIVDRPARPLRPLSRSILYRVMALAVVVAVVLGSAQAWLSYRSELERFDLLVQSLSSSHLPLLTVALWDIEPRAVEQQVDLIASQPEFARVAVSSLTGLEFSHSKPGRQYDEPDKQVLIPHPHDAELSLGTLAITFDRSYLNHSIWQAVARTALQNVVFILLICLLVYRVIVRQLEGPLKAIADYSQQLRPERDNPPLLISRPGRKHRDEIDLLVEGFDTLREAISRFGRERDQAIQALQDEKDSLDDRVRERTRYIQQVNDFLELLSRISAELLDRSVGSHRSAMEVALRELAQRSHAHHCGIARRLGQGPWCWEYVWRDPERGREALDVPLPEHLSTGWFVGTEGLPPETLACVVTSSDGRASGLVFTGIPVADLDALDHRLLQLTGEVLFKIVDRWEHLEALETSRRELFRLSRTDHLTGIANRRYFEEARLIEGRRAQRTGAPVSVLMIDVDLFKSFNDRYGHGAGDECLTRIADILGYCCRRAGELPARLGGEEFAVLLPEHDLDAALEAAERIRRAIEDLAIPHQNAPSGRVTVSLGAATWTPAAEPPDSLESVFDVLMAEADRQLYTAKDQGRNRVCPDLANPAVRLTSQDGR